MSYIATSMTAICDRIRLLALDHFEFLLVFMNGVLCLDVNVCFLSSMQAIKVGLISRGRNSCFYAHGYYKVKYPYQSFSTFSDYSLSVFFPFPDTFQFLVANSYLGSCFQNFFPGIHFFLLSFLQRNPFQRIFSFRLVQKLRILTMKEGKAIEKDEHRVLVTHPNNAFSNKWRCTHSLVILTGQFQNGIQINFCLRADNNSFLYYNIFFSSNFFIQVSYIFSQNKRQRIMLQWFALLLSILTCFFRGIVYSSLTFFFFAHSALQLLGKMDLLWKRILMLHLGIVLN